MKRIRTVDFMKMKWLHLIKKGLFDEYTRTKDVRPFFAALYPEDADNYQSYVYRQFELSDEGYKKLLCFNFSHGTPICACMVAFMIQAQTASGLVESALFLTLEDPIYCRKEVFIEKEIEGEKKLLKDDYLTSFAVFPKIISQFMNIIDTGCVHNTQN